MRTFRIALMVAGLLIMTFGKGGFVEAAKHPPSFHITEGINLDV